MICFVEAHARQPGDGSSPAKKRVPSKKVCDTCKIEMSLVHFRVPIKKNEFLKPDGTPDRRRKWVYLTECTECRQSRDVLNELFQQRDEYSKVERPEGYRVSMRQRISRWFG